MSRDFALSSQSIFDGSIVLTLNTNPDIIDNLVEYFSMDPPLRGLDYEASYRYYSAYAYVTFKHPDQYIGNNHLLTFKSDPTIFTIYRLVLEYKRYPYPPITKGEPETIDTLPNFKKLSDSRDPDVSCAILIALGVHLSNGILDREECNSLSIIHACFLRDASLIVNLDQEGMFNISKYDFFDPLKSWSVFEDIRKRLRYLKDYLPEYYNQIAVPYYKKYLETNRLNYSRYAEISESFPEICEPTSEAVYNLSSLSDVAKAYILGFNILEGIPSSSDLEKTMNKLFSLGKEKYYQELLEGKVIDGHNDQDTLGEKLVEYNPFDLFPICDTSGKYWISRPEWEYVIQHKTNPYTNEAVSNSILILINSRMALSNELGLPKPDILTREFESLITGRVVQPSRSLQESNPLLNMMRSLGFDVEFFMV